jgi:uncharacterized membrane protein YbhN (UPF0104 family)
MKHKWINRIGFLVGSGFFAWLVFESFHELQETAVIWNAHTIVSGLNGVGIYVIGNIGFALAWVLALRALGEHKGIIQPVRVYLISAVGKYIPGNVAQHFGLVALAHLLGVPVKKAVASVLLELIWCGLAAAILTVPFLISPQVHQVVDSIDLPSFLVPILIIALLVAIAIIFVSLNARHKWLKFEELLSRPRTIFLGFIVTVITFVLYSGLSGFVGSQVLGNGFWEFALVFPAAFLLGFITPGAPAGLGTRELVMLIALAPEFGQTDVMIVVILLRIVTTLGDGLSFVVASWLPKAQLQ